MKHIKTYKIFEAISSTYLELDVRDMFLELEEDYGYCVDISMRPSGVDMFCVEASRDELFQWSDVKEYFERSKEYVCENGWSLTKVVVCYYPQSAFNDKVKVLNKHFKIMRSCDQSKTCLGEPHRDRLATGDAGSRSGPAATHS